MFWIFQAYKRKTEAAKKEYLKALAAYRASLVSKVTPWPVGPALIKGGTEALGKGQRHSSREGQRSPVGSPLPAPAVRHAFAGRFMCMSFHLIL